LRATKKRKTVTQLVYHERAVLVKKL